MKTQKQKVSSGMIGMPETKTLEEVEATRKLARFKAENVTDYERNLKYMTECDLYNHAIEIGIRPSSERADTVRALIKIFKETQGTVASYGRPREKSKPEIIGNGRTFEDFMRTIH